MRIRCRPAGVLAGLMLLAATTVQAADIHVAAGVVVADNDDSQCSLIGAIQNANAGDSSGDSDCAAGTAGADSLILPENANYSLDDSTGTFANPGDNNGLNGLPLISSDISIAGNGSTIERDPAAAEFRLMNVIDSGSLSLDSITLKGGRAVGTGQFSGGFYGGAITSAGSLSIHNATLTGNSAYGGGAIFFQADAPTVTITDSDISGNQAVWAGGAMYLTGGFSFDTHTITNTRISDNVADSGGALFLNDGKFQLKNCTVSGNQATHGGAVSITWVAAPGGQQPGARFNASNTAFIDNSVTADGGAIWVHNTHASCHNCTFSGNSAASDGGAIFANNLESLRVVRSTFVGNSVPAGGRGAAYSDTAAAAPDFANNLFINNDCDVYSGAMAEGNISNEATCDQTGAPTPGAANIGPLAFNGGPTQTYALTPGHPAIDAAVLGGHDFCSNSFTDQRGIPRAYGTKCDVGAFEFGATFDLGDAPDPGFPSLLASNGAVHVTNNPASASPPFLGANPPDSEADAAPGVNADGDDLSGDNDEDGVATSTVLLIGQSNDLPVTVTGTGLLNAWVDFNNDGDWDDAGEQVASDVDMAPLGGLLPVFVPGDAPPGTVMSRFRVSSAGGDRVTGLANDGEVEDHLLTLEGAPACSGDDLVVSERTFASGEVISCVGNTSLSTSGSVVVGSGSTVTFQAPLITLSGGFSIELGGTFNAGP